MMITLTSLRDGELQARVAHVSPHGPIRSAYCPPPSIVLPETVEVQIQFAHKLQEYLNLSRLRC